MFTTRLYMHIIEHFSSTYFRSFIVMILLLWVMSAICKEKEPPLEKGEKQVKPSDNNFEPSQL